MRLRETIVIPFLAIPWIVTVAIGMWFVVQRFPPSGVFIADTKMNGASPFIHPFQPAERVTVPGIQDGGWIGQRVLGDPVYGSARVPGPYQDVTFDIEFRPVRQTLLEFGIARDSNGANLDLQPLYSKELENPDWTAVSNGYVKEGVSESRLRSTDPNGIATWNATTSMALLEDVGQVSRTTHVSLRGGHDFYLVPVDRTIDFTLNLQDSNRKEGRTVAVFRIFRGDEEIQTKVFGTNASQETRMGIVAPYRILLKDLEAGVYRIQYQADDDVFIRNIQTTSKHWVIGPRLNFGDVVGYATSSVPGIAWTNSRHIVAETFHIEGLQSVELGGQSVDVVRTHDVFRIDRDDTSLALQRITAPNGDMRIVGDGWFALDKDRFFQPKPIRMTDGTVFENENIKGVVTPYQRPESIGDGWYRATVRFELVGNEDQLRIVLSSPGIVSRLGGVDIRRIRATYTRPRLNFSEWKSLILQEMKNAWHRL
ncbi:MAG: hypothetical protein NUV81_01015 [bacterium]|nr:hypothetical protein [bacterium]